MGLNVKHVPEACSCCGSAGVHRILQPQIVRRLRARNVITIEKTKPEIIATGNTGCIAQSGHGTALPIVHTVELTDWAQGGPLAVALAYADFEDRPAPPLDGERPGRSGLMDRHRSLIRKKDNGEFDVQPAFDTSRG